MNKIKAALVSALIATTLLFGVAPAIYAQASPATDAGPAPSISDPLAGSCNSAGAKKTDYCKNQVTAEKSRTIIFGNKGFVGSIVQLIVFLTGVISVVMVIIGGLRYVLSNGDANGTAAAKNTILYALVGLGVAAIAQLIVSFVLSKFV